MGDQPEVSAADVLRSLMLGTSIQQEARSRQQRDTKIAEHLDSMGQSWREAPIISRIIMVMLAGSVFGIPLAALTLLLGNVRLADPVLWCTLFVPLPFLAHLLRVGFDRKDLLLGIVGLAVMLASGGLLYFT